jgi:hypothetical protein
MDRYRLRGQLKSLTPLERLSSFGFGGIMNRHSFSTPCFSDFKAVIALVTALWQYLGWNPGTTAPATSIKPSGEVHQEMVQYSILRDCVSTVRYHHFLVSTDPSDFWEFFVLQVKAIILIDGLYF